MTAHFRTWLRGRYGTDDALRTAWAMPEATLDGAEVPDIARRRQRADGWFRDPRADRWVVDYTTCQHEAVTRAIEHFARLVKEAWPRPILTGTFYGYFFSCFGRDQAGGHLDVHRLLRSPWIDYLSAPSCYYPDASAVGDPYRSRGLLESVRLAGKLWLDEMDQAPPLAAFHHADYNDSLRASIAMVRRNLAWAHTHGTGFWFYDFGPSGFAEGVARKRISALGVCGWWDQDALLADVARVRAVLERKAAAPFRTGADVLAVFDTAPYHLTPSTREEPDAISHAGNNWGPLGLHRAGIVYDAIHLADLPAADLAHYRVVIFFNTSCMTAQQRRHVRDTVARGGRHVVFVHAPAYSDGQCNDDAHVREVTGLDLRRLVSGTKTEITGTAAFLPGRTWAVCDAPVRPVYSVADPDARVLATYAGTDLAAAASCVRSDHTAWYIALPMFDAALFRELGALLPAHRYSDRPGDIVYAGGGLVAVHAKEGGTRTVTLRNGRTTQLNLGDGPATVFLDDGTGEMLA
jgi:hypothetical protein